MRDLKTNDRSFFYKLKLLPSICKKSFEVLIMAIIRSPSVKVVDANGQISTAIPECVRWLHSPAFRAIAGQNAAILARKNQ